MIDTHIHLLEPGRFTYEWTKGLPALSGRFDLSDYQNASHDSGIQAGVFMEVDCEESADGNSSQIYTIS
jgi:predicted TIM-barrel fold metal-dependent hydrolase